MVLRNDLDSTTFTSSWIRTKSICMAALLLMAPSGTRHCEKTPIHPGQSLPSFPSLRTNPNLSTAWSQIIAIGFDDLRNRIDAQDQQATNHTKKLADLKSHLEALTKAHSTSNSTRLLRAGLGQIAQVGVLPFYFRIF